MRHRYAAAADLHRPPKYATAPNLALRTHGHQVGAIGAAMGRPLMPHQRYIADVATEVNPPGSRLVFRYQVVVISLPRQTGKTTLTRPVFVERCIGIPGTRAFMTAQLGKDSSARWADLVADLQTNPLFADWTKLGRSKGSERATFPNGSFISPFAPGPDALHGETPPLVGIDEAWAFSEDEGRALRQAIDPAQQTRRDRQLWIFSAAGDANSAWWLELQAAGRAAIADPASSMAYFEWGLADDADPYDRAAWEFHPGLDGLITLDDLAQFAASTPHGDWLRAYMNRTLLTSGAHVIDLDAWDTLCGDQTAPALGKATYAYDVSVDRRAASVWSAWLGPDGKTNLHLVRASDTGSDWLAAFVAELHTADPASTIAADDGGPARAVTDALTRAGIDVRLLSGKDASTSWAAFKGKVQARELVHDGSSALRSAIEVAVERPVGDAMALSRRHSVGPIDTLISAEVAAWFADRHIPEQLFIG